MFHFLDVITAAFAVVLIVSNIASVKILSLGPFSFDGGTILFPLSYIFGDILTEVYGYVRARRVIWIGFVLNFLTVIVFAAVTRLPPALGWTGQESFQNIFGAVPRIVAGSFLAYLAGAFTNSFILAKMKIKTAGKFFSLRAITSTIAGEFLDTTIFLLVAFAGVLPWNLLVVLWVSNYVFKVFIEVVFLPLTGFLTKWLKNKEGIDVFDTNTDFNPLKIEC